MLQLSPDSVAVMLPHRPPLRLVDRVTGFEDEPQSTLTAEFSIRHEEPVLAGHFPGAPLWPGVYTIEGLGQTCNLLIVVLDFLTHVAGEGASRADGLEQLRQMDAALTNPGVGRQDHAALAVPLAEAARDGFGLSGRVDIRFLAPVFPGQRLDYRAQLTHRQGQVYRFDVEARVDGHAVARGAMTASRTTRLQR